MFWNMKFLLLALTCLVSAAEKHLQFSGKFNTIYLAGKYVSTTVENSQVRMLMREVKYYNQNSLMSMVYYVRKNGKCQLHTIWADKTPWTYCTINRLVFLSMCPKRNGTHYMPSTWKVRDADHHFPIYFYPGIMGGLPRRRSEFFISIHFFSNTTILFEVQFVNYLNYPMRLAGALATGTNITKEMWDEYVNVIEYLRIPTENIENIYETDACPKWEP